MQSDQGLHCLLNEPLDTAECIKRNGQPGTQNGQPGTQNGQPGTQNGQPGRQCGCTDWPEYGKMGRDKSGYLVNIFSYFPIKTYVVGIH